MELPDTHQASRSSYRDIVRSSALIAGSTGFSVVMRIVRMKVIAVILGPSGIGLLGVFSSVTQLAETAVILGVETTGVRSIADAKGKDDREAVARSTSILGKGTFWLGLIGSIVFLTLVFPISRFTFGDDDRAGALAILSLTIFFGSICAGRRAVLQGLRRIADLAAMNMVSAFSGTVIGVICIYFLGEQGIVPLLVAISAIAMLTAWWFSRKTRVASIEMTFAEVLRGMEPLLKLGVVFMSSTLMSAAVAYLSRVFLIRQFGMPEVGLYQAASVLSMLYTGFVLQAMGADFYPRLVAARDSNESNRLVNEQVEVGLLLAVPGVVATLTFSSLVINLFYSPAFLPAVEILRWQILGVLLQVAAWPLGYVLVAQGRSKLFFWSEFTTHGLHFLLIWMGVMAWGLVGTGIAYFLVYVFYIALIATIVRGLTGFKWSPANVRLGMLIAPLTLLVFTMQWVLTGGMAMLIGCAVTAAVSGYSLRKFHSILGWDALIKLSKT